MKLYITPGSPYARMARIVVLEKGLRSRVEIVVAQTRRADSPYYRINPSGRVPYLVRDDGVGLEESAVICAYLDRLDGNPAFDPPAGDQAWEARRLEGLARSMLDGLAVWGREILRPRDERSPSVLQHEAERGRRMADLWEGEIDHPADARCAQHRADHARLCPRARSTESRPSLAARAPKAGRMVRSDCFAPFVRSDRAAGRIGERCYTFSGGAMTAAANPAVEPSMHRQRRAPRC